MDFKYKISLPSQLTENKKYPVIYVLHGMGSDEVDIYSLVEDLRETFILIAIRGPHAVGSGYAYYQIKRIGFPDMESFDSSIQDLSRFIEDAKERLPIDQDRQFVVGFSQGAILAMTLGLSLGPRLRGIVAIHGYIPDQIKTRTPIDNLDPLSVLITQGERDEMFPPMIGEANKDFFVQRCSDVSYQVYSHGHWVSDQERLDIRDWLKQKAK